MSLKNIIIYCPAHIPSHHGAEHLTVHGIEQTSEHPQDRIRSVFDSISQQCERTSVILVVSARKVVLYVVVIMKKLFVTSSIVFSASPHLHVLAHEALRVLVCQHNGYDAPILRRSSAAAHHLYLFRLF